MEEQKAIYDFYRFPGALYNLIYEPKSNLKLITKISKIDRCLNYGAWSVLRHMYPKQNIPTFKYQ